MQNKCLKIEKDEKIYDKIEDDETRDKTGSKANKEMEKKEVLQKKIILKKKKN